MSEFETNKVILGDNLEIMQGFPGESVDLIYLDPPYNSGRDYDEFDDRWEGMEEYLNFMRNIMTECRRLLKATGSVYLHVDQTASHYLKIEMDRIFGRANFRNDIIWCYSWPSAARRNFPRKHDNILFYSKGEENVFNREDVMVPHTRPIKPGEGVTVAFTKEQVDYYNARGKYCQDWWADIGQALRSTKERDGYPTQKPTKLLKRIIKASSNEGDLVLDPFCGSGTTLIAAGRLLRKYIGIDVNEEAVKLSNDRIAKAAFVSDDDMLL